MKTKKLAAIILAVIVMMCVLSGCKCEHNWVEATCDAPKTCSICGETEGESLDHDWIAATCTEAKHCSRCCLIEGTPAEHNWIEATCFDPKTCADCKLTEGEPLAHSVKKWQVVKEATCASEGERAGTCEQCGVERKESIEALPHSLGEWTVSEDFVLNSSGGVKPGTEVAYCTVCGKEAQTREYTCELTTSQKNCAIKAYDEIEFWHCGPEFLISEILVGFEDYPREDAEFVVEHLDVDWDKQAVLYAQQNGKGESKGALSNDLAYYGFSSEQIEKALAAVGY